MKIYDISIPIKSGMTVYPNNPEVLIEKASEIERGASSNLTKISLGSHTGTHLDAPSHSLSGGKSITDLPIESFIGDAYVYDFSYLKPGECAKVIDFEKVRKPGHNEIILIKTSNSNRGYTEFYNDFVYLDGEAADYLASIGIKMFGIDYLSVKQKGSDDNRPHNSLLSKNIPILEGINLAEISEGQYELVALPLKIDGCDGSPTRAILIKR